MARTQKPKNDDQADEPTEPTEDAAGDEEVDASTLADPSDDVPDTSTLSPSDDVPDSPTLGDAPAGYVWVTRKRTGVMLGAVNTVWDKPSLIDAKSFAELEVQGYVVVDGPDSTPGDDVDDA